MALFIATKQDVCRYYKEDLWGELALKKNIFLKINKFLFYKIKKRKFTGNQYEILKLDNKIFKKTKRLTPKEIRYFHKEKLKAYFLDFDEFSLRSWFLQAKPGKLVTGNFYKHKSLRHAVSNRLDHLVYTFGWANSIGQAKNFIKNGVIQINNYIPTRVNYVPEVGDEIKVRSNFKSLVFRYLRSLRQKRLRNLLKVNKLRIRYYKYVKAHKRFYIFSKRNLKKYKFLKIKSLRIDRLAYLTYHWRFYKNRPTASSIFSQLIHPKNRFKRKLKLPFSFLYLKKFFRRFYSKQSKQLPGFEQKVDQFKKKLFPKIARSSSLTIRNYKRIPVFKKKPKTRAEKLHRKKLLKEGLLVKNPLQVMLSKMVKHIRGHVKYFRPFVPYLNLWFRNRAFKKSKLEGLKDTNFRKLLLDFFGTTNKLKFYLKPYSNKKILGKKFKSKKKSAKLKKLTANSINFSKKNNLFETSFRQFLGSKFAKKLYEKILNFEKIKLQKFIPKPADPVINIKKSKLKLSKLEKRFLYSLGDDRPATSGTGYFYSRQKEYTRQDEPFLKSTLVRSRLRPYFSKNPAKNQFFDIKFMHPNEIRRRFDLAEQKYLQSFGSDRPATSGSGFYYFEKGQQKISYVRPYFPNNPVKNAYYSIKCFRDINNPEHLKDLRWYNKSTAINTAAQQNATSTTATQPQKIAVVKPFPKLFKKPKENPLITFERLINPSKFKEVKEASVNKLYNQEQHHERVRFRHRNAWYSLNKVDTKKIKNFVNRVWQTATKLKHNSKFSKIKVLRSFFLKKIIRQQKFFKKNFLENEYKSIDFGIFFKKNNIEQAIYNHFKILRSAFKEIRSYKNYFHKRFFSNLFLKKYKKEILYGQFFSYDIFSSVIDDLTRFTSLNATQSKLLAENFYINKNLSFSNRPFYMHSKFLKYLRILPTKFISDRSPLLSLSQVKNQSFFLHQKYVSLKSALNFSLNHFYINFLKKKFDFKDLSGLNKNDFYRKSLLQLFKNAVLNVSNRLNGFYRSTSTNQSKDSSFNNSIIKSNLKQKISSIFKPFGFKPKTLLFKTKYNRSKLFNRQKKIIKRLKKAHRTGSLIAKKLPQFLLNYKFLLATYIGHQNRYHGKRNSGIRWLKFSKKFTYYFPFKFNLENFLSYYSGGRTLEPLNKESTIYVQFPKIPYNPHITGTFKKKFLNK